MPDEAQSEHGILNPAAVQRLYDQLAPRYDLLASIYQLAGSRQLAERGMQLLELAPRDTVVDLGCGTGVNLPTLAALVGPTGRAIGVDLSAQMLDQARQRIRREGLDNVELVQDDVRQYDFPDQLAGVISTFALEMVPEHDEVIARATKALSPAGRIALMGLREPPSWPQWAVEIGLALGRPFGVSEAYTNVRPWEAIQRRTQEIRFETKIFGALYLSVGQAT